jgi:gas vesicle protein
MENGNGTSAGMFMVGLLVGGIAGAAAALLLAPQSGEETRARIRQRGEELQGKAEDTLNKARARAEAVASDLKRRAEELQTQGHVILEEGQKQLAKALEETKKAAEAAVAIAPAEQETEVVKGRKKIPAKA